MNRAIIVLFVALIGTGCGAAADDIRESTGTVSQATSHNVEVPNDPLAAERAEAATMRTDIQTLRTEIVQLRNRIREALTNAGGPDAGQLRFYYVGYNNTVSVSLQLLDHSIAELASLASDPEVTAAELDAEMETARGVVSQVENERIDWAPFEYAVLGDALFD